MGGALQQQARSPDSLLQGCCDTSREEGFRVDVPVVNSAAPLAGDGAYRREAYYKEWDSLGDALASQDVVLVRGSWLEELYRKGDALPMRQRLPAEAAWSAAELMLHVRDHRKPTPQVLSISYAWLSRQHPDPDGFHLRSFAPLLRHFARHCKIGVESLAIFIDWCSLHQEPRSQVEQEAYERAMSKVDLWYAHCLVEVWLLSRVPDGATAYEERGWPKFERALATMTSPPESTLDLGLLRAGWKNWGQVASDCQAQRRPPETPDSFAAEIGGKVFTHREDARFLAERYREVFGRALGQEAQLWYAGLGWGDQEAKELAKLLPLCSRSLKDLELRGNDISNVGAVALAEALPLCDALERLSLDGNCIGREGQQELHEAWQRSGKPRFGLELGEQAPGPRTPGRSRAGQAGVPGANEQLNQLLARQAAFEARIKSTVARLTDGLVEVADAVAARNRARAKAGAATPPSTQAGAQRAFGPNAASSAPPGAIGVDDDLY